jgi:hypothetical protein
MFNCKIVKCKDYLQAQGQKREIIVQYCWEQNFDLYWYQ